MHGHVVCVAHRPDTNRLIETCSMQRSMYYVLCRLVLAARGMYTQWYTQLS